MIGNTKLKVGDPLLRIRLVPAQPTGAKSNWRCGEPEGPRQQLFIMFPAPFLNNVCSVAGCIFLGRETTATWHWRDIPCLQQGSRGNLHFPPTLMMPVLQSVTLLTSWAMPWGEQCLGYIDDQHYLLHLWVVVIFWLISLLYIHAPVISCISTTYNL